MGGRSPVSEKMINAITAFVQGRTDIEFDYDTDDMIGMGLPVRSRNVDYVWDGWDAALIVFKQKKAHHAIIRDYYNKCFPENEDVTRVMTSEEHQTFLRKRKAGEISGTEELDIVIKTVSQSDQNLDVDNDSMEFYSAMYSPEIDGKRIDKFMIAKAVLAVSLKAIRSVVFGWEEMVFTLSNEDFKYKFVRESVLRSVAKFVLSVFPMECLERVYNPNEISMEYEELWSDIDLFKCDPLVVIAERRVEVNKFSTLREHDVCDVIQQHQDGKKGSFFVDLPESFIPHVMLENFSEHDIHIVMSEMDKYVPLKVDREMQLILEIARRKSYRVLDTLFFEALKDMKVSVLDFSPSPDEFKEVAFVREELVEGICFGLQGLLRDLETAIHYLQEVLSFPLLHGSLIPCTDELIEVIKIADHERRMRRHHYISMQHILFGLSLSRVGDVVRKIFENRELPSNLPMLSIYKLASDAAEFLDNEKVGLEHFVMAILFGKQENGPHIKALEEHSSSLVLDYDAWDAHLLDCLRNSDAECGVESFEDKDIYREIIPDDERENYVSGGLSLLESLNKALRSGMKLPSIRINSV